MVLDGVENGEEENEVPFAVWDPDCPWENATAYSGLVRPVRVTLGPGDMLYLPCMWWVVGYGLACSSVDERLTGGGRYHKVSQSCSPEGVCIAVNYW